MAGVRMAAPLLALREGHAAWAVGVLLGLFAAAPIVLALAAGRLADRHGYHGRCASPSASRSAAACCAVASTMLPARRLRRAVRGGAVVGAGANFGLIAIQRTAGRMAHDADRAEADLQWLGLAPALANVVGPVLAGTLIDLGGFRLAFIALAAAAAGQPRRGRASCRSSRAPTAPRRCAGRSSWDLLREPGLRAACCSSTGCSRRAGTCTRSWCRSSATSAASARRRSASCSACSRPRSRSVRLAIPMLAHRLRESQVLVGAMLLRRRVFARLSARAHAPG